MKDILNSKLSEYKSHIFENKEYRAWLRNSDLWMALYSCLRIRGIDMDKRELVDLLDGKIMEDVPIEIYGFVHSFKDLYKEMQASLIMQESLNERLLSRFYDILIGGDGFRKTNPIIYKWAYIAPHFTQMHEKLAELFRNCQRQPDAIVRAQMVHNGVAEIYPFGDDSAVMAMVCFYYALLEGGIPLPSITVDDEDYNKLMSAYFDKGSLEINEMFDRSLMNRIDSVLLFGKESEEQ